MSNICPVCGYAKLREPAYDDFLTPSFDICPSCGFQYGVSDDDAGYSFVQWREQWIKGGTVWASARKPPANWNPKKQLENIGVF